MTTYKKDCPKKKHILLADDEGPLRRSIKLILRQDGYKVTAVADGQMALKTTLDLRDTTECVDLLMTDLQMGGLTGLELIDELSLNKISIPILVATGYGNKEVVVQLLRKGCMEYIDKPLDPSDVLNRVAQMLNKQARQDADEKRKSERQKKEMEELSRNIEAYRSNLDRLAEQVNSAIIAHKDLVQLDPDKYKVSLAYKNRPLAELGGDFVDINNTEVGCDIFLADVAGHDMGASYHTVLLKAFFEENCRTGYKGAAFFQLLNKQLVESTIEERMVTGMFVRINLQNMTAEIISSGHPPPVKIRQSVPIPTSLQVSGDVLGIHDEISFESRSFIITPGDRLFMFTDGVIGATQIDENSGESRKLTQEGLEDLIAQHVSETLQEHVDKVWNTVMEFCRKSPLDDMLLVGIEIPK